MSRHRAPGPAPAAELAPLRWHDGSLAILDQRALPASETWLRCESPGEVAEAIRTMAIRGAPAIGLAAAYGCALAFDGGERCTTESRVAFEEAARDLAATRPTAANLGWAIARARETFEASESSAMDAGHALLELAHRLVREEVESERRLAAFATDRFFEPGVRALTHCNAGPLATGGHGTAGGVLRTAFDEGRLAEVWVSETRPLLQGARITAWELGHFGIPHRLVTDSSAGGLMANGVVDRVVVGADRVAANGDVANKVGTYPLAVLAARHDIPFIVAAPLCTLDPATPDGGAIPIEERDPHEVTAPLGVSAAPEGTSALNLAFDVTPAELVTAIVTEAGVLEAPYEESIRRALG